ncbi:2219_t:CDS:2 [Paraglomus brasilianum]|uniref:2219_t:CDS:1 n=1 Tax=Paraglomus brasilianum TaxID=144538 RepID=A0A9N8Z8Q7_9GLOM|nr:2219_t:CDS:2 [Paraglomus brasilianum]
MSSHFTPAEDAQLINLFRVFGSRWRQIAALMRTRSARSIRERYVHHLSPGIDLSPLTFDEQNKIRQLHKIHGSKYVLIARYLSGRTSLQVKNFCYNRFRRVTHPLQPPAYTRSSKMEISQLLN